MFGDVMGMFADGVGMSDKKLGSVEISKEFVGTCWDVGGTRGDFWGCRRDL